MSIDLLPDIIEISEERVREIQQTSDGRVAATSMLAYARDRRAAGEDVHFYVCGPYIFAGSKPKKDVTP